MPPAARSEDESGGIRRVCAERRGRERALPGSVSLDAVGPLEDENCP